MSTDLESARRFERSIMFNLGFDGKLEGLFEEQRQGHHIKVIKDTYNLLFRKQSQEITDSSLLIRFYKMYTVSINKLLDSLLTSEQERAAGIRQLIDSLDHTLLKWAQELSPLLDRASKHNLEEYFQQVLLGTVNKSLYYKRLGHVRGAVEVLEGVANLYNEIKNSKRAKTLYICGRFALTLGLHYLEGQSMNNALTRLLEGLKCFANEQKARLKGVAYLTDKRFSAKQAYKIRRNITYITVAIYNLGVAYTMEKRDIEALESYRTCKWYYEPDRGIFPDKDPSQIHKFILESSREEEVKILASIEAENESKKKVEAPKVKTALEQDEVKGYIDSLWGKVMDAKELNDRIRANNFKLILDSVHGKFKPVKAITNFEKYRTTALEKTAPQFTNFSKSTNLTATGLKPMTNRSVMKSSFTQRRPGTATMRNTAVETTAGSEDDKKMLNPDEYFKTRICSDLQISSEWLDESDPRKRFRQDMIETIMKREKNSHRSLNILKDFLMVKRRDKVIKEMRDKDPKALEKEAFYEIGHKMYSLQKSVSTASFNEGPKKGKTVPGTIMHHTGTLSTVGFGNFQKAESLYTPSPKPTLTTLSEDRIKKEQELKKKMTKVAEELQRDIFYLEKTVAKPKTRDLKVISSKKKEKTLEDTDSAQSTCYQNLANSVVKRAKEETLKKENAQRKNRPAGKRISRFPKLLKPAK